MNVSDLSALASVRIHAPPSAVCGAFVNAEAMSQYWFTRHDGGLKAGESCRWYLGDSDDAFSFEVHVKELHIPHRLVIEWPGEDGELTQVTWLFQEAEGGDTTLTIEETGFLGSDSKSINRLLDSTRGFNQVVIAAKAFIEHGVAINLVADHA